MAFRALISGPMLEISGGIQQIPGGPDRELTSIVIPRAGQIIEKDLSAPMMARYKAQDPYMMSIVEYGVMEDGDEADGEPVRVFVPQGISGEDVSSAPSGNDSKEVAKLKKKLADSLAATQVAEAQVKDLTGKLATAESDLEQATAPQPLNYDRLSAKALDAEVADRKLVVSGSGAGGNVVKSDNVKALMENDQKH